MKKRQVNNWKNKVIAIVQHEADEGGPGKVVVEYVRSQCAQTILHIAHPNLYIKSGYKKASRFDVYVQGQIRLRSFARKWKLPEPLLYIKDVFLTLYWLGSQPGKIDIFVGLGNINAACGIVLKLLGKVNCVIYYVIDYVPNRFSNPVLNAFYHWLDYLAALTCDRTWNISANIVEGREKRWNRIFPNQTIVPHGLYFDEKKVVSVEKIKKHSLVYLGYLNKEQGIELLLRSIPTIAKKINDISVTIIGTGNYELELKMLVNELDITKRVVFTGLIPEVSDMEKILAQNAIGVAMYKPDHAFSFYADPGKIKHYLSVGLPILMTQTSPIAKIIEKNRCGMVVSYNVQAFSEAVIQLFTNTSMYREYRENAISLAENYDWQIILKKAFDKLI